MTAKGELSDEVRRFCAELNKTRAYNVALLIDGDQATADKVADIVKNAGTHLVGVKVISLGGFLMFGGTLTPELETELVAWVDEMVAGCV
jgi:predicted sugar kinase